MSVKIGIKPYCFLKALNGSYHSVHLHDGETTRISRDGRILEPMEDHDLTHIRVKPNVTEKLLFAIYVNNFKGCWINDCKALCWYKYTLQHGHSIKLQPDTFEYRVTFFPPPEIQKPNYLTLKIPKSLTEIPAKVIEEIVGEAKNEFWNEKKEKIKINDDKKKILKPTAKRTIAKRQQSKAVQKSTQRSAAPQKQKIKSLLLKKSTQRKVSKQKLKTKKKKSARKLAPTETYRHVHFETQPKTKHSQIQVEHLTTATVQTIDAYFKESASLLRHVIFKPTPEAPTNRDTTKCVKFTTDCDSCKSVVFVEPEEQGFIETKLTRSEVFECVEELYRNLQEEDKQHKANKHFAMHLIDRLLRKTFNVKVEDAQYMIDFLKEVVEDAVTMKDKDKAFVGKMIDDLVEDMFVERRRLIQDGFFEGLLEEIFDRIPIQESEEVTISEETPLVSSSSMSESSSRSEDSNKKSVIEEICE